MSASAPVFNPSKPLPGALADVTGQGAGAGPSRKGPGGDDHGDEPEEDLSAITAAAVASSRVTRPLPNSRRPAPGADFVPKAATVPKSTDQKENTRRLIVVLSQVSLIPNSLTVSVIRCNRGEITNGYLGIETSWTVLISPIGMFGGVQSIFWKWGQELDG
jgi:rRNA small subunit pseudouridine methyltransferase Nep1